MRQAIPMQWFSNLPKAEQEEFKKSLVSSKKVLDRLIQMCYTSIKDGESTKLTDYDSPSWSHRQADQNGYVRAYQEIIQLLSLPDNG